MGTTIRNGTNARARNISIKKQPNSNFITLPMRLTMAQMKIVKKALCRYIDEQSYNPEIKDFVKTFQWVED
jgi:hypothetical protein